MYKRFDQPGSQTRFDSRKVVGVSVVSSCFLDSTINVRSFIDPPCQNRDVNESGLIHMLTTEEDVTDI